MLFVLEGIDGSGKSTVIRVLEELGYCVYATPPKAFKEKRDAIDRQATPEKQYLFFKESVLAASKELSQNLQGITPIIVDRYWITTLVYHHLKNVAVNPAHFDGIIKPDHTFFLTVSEEEQRRRVLQRGVSVVDQEMRDRYRELLRAYDYFFKLTNAKVETIDTTRLLPTNVADIIVRKIKDTKVSQPRAGKRRMQ